MLKIYCTLSTANVLINELFYQFVDLCGTIDEVRKAWNRHIRLFPHSVRTTSYRQLTTHTKSLQLAKEGREDNIVTKHQQPSGDSNPDSLVQIPLHDIKLPSLENCDSRRSGQDSTNLNTPEQKVPAQENHDIQFEQAPSNQSPSREADNAAEERAMSPSFKISEQSRKDMPETNVPSVDLVSSPKQPREDATKLNVPSSNLMHEVAEGTESVQTLKEHSNGNDLKQDSDHEHQQDVKPLSLDSLSLHPQDKPSPDSNPFVPFVCEAPQETCFSDRSIIESNEQKNDEDSLTHRQRKIKAFDSPQIETEEVNPTSSRSHQNPIAREPGSQRRMPTNSGGNWHRMNNSGKVRRESKFGFRGHLQRRSTQQRQVSPRQHPRAELGGPMPMSQGYPSQIASPQSLQIQQSSQAQNQYQTTPANITPPPPPVSWPAQNMQQPDYTSSQPVQGSEEHGMQNSEAYNQMWQYYYYQQQIFLQQQQQPQLPQQQPQLPQQQQQQHLHMSQQYQHQLQYQQQYVQWQQQQYLYQQQQQLYQQQQLQQQPQQEQQPDQLYMNQVPQQQQLEQNQHQQQNTQSQIQEWNHNYYQQVCHFYLIIGSRNKNLFAYLRSLCHSFKYRERSKTATTSQS